MKKVLCPKCDNTVTFNEQKYEEGRSLFFVCPHCGKKFSIQVNQAKTTDTPQYGHIIVLENAYCYRQQLPLFAGDNIIGRRSKGTNIHVPIESSDTTMERQHCIINISVHKQGKTIYTLRDFPSTSGTFLKHELLNKRERVILENGSIVTIGATTFIVYFSEEEQTYTD